MVCHLVSHIIYKLVWVLMWVLDLNYVGRDVVILLEYFTSCRSACI